MPKRGQTAYQIYPSLWGRFIRLACPVQRTLDGLPLAFGEGQKGSGWLDPCILDTGEE